MNILHANKFAPNYAQTRSYAQNPNFNAKVGMPKELSSSLKNGFRKTSNSLSEVLNDIKGATIVLLGALGIGKIKPINEIENDILKK